MKTLEIYRHSLKDGQYPNTIGPKGMSLAMSQGVNRAQEAIRYQVSAHGVEVRTAQTLLGFLYGQCELMPQPLLSVEGFGNDNLFAEMVAPPTFRDIAKGVGNFSALLLLHSEEQVKSWAKLCHDGVLQVFAQIEDGEVGLAISHSPSIELAMWRAMNFAELPDSYAVMKEMDGVVLQQDAAGIISVIKKISAPAIK